MIKKVYKTEKINRTHVVNKPIVHKETRYKTESITVNSKKGYCGRCGNYFNYGDNLRNPEECPYCKCVDCGTSIRFRKRENYSGRKIIRCYSCWYKYEYKRNYYGPAKGYEISYTYTKPEKGNVETKHIPYTYEWTEYKDVEEEYTEDKKRIVHPKKRKYNNDNVVFSNELNLYTILSSKIKNIDNHIISESDGWYGCYDINVDFKRMYNKPIPEKNDFEIWGINNFMFNEMIISEKQTLEEFSDVVGFYPNVPAYIQGHPLCMYNNIRKNVVDVVKSITIYVNLAIDSLTDYKQYQIRGKMIHALIDEIYNTPTGPNEKIKVNLVLLDATFINGETIIQNINIYHDDLIKNRTIIYNVLSNISFYRVLLMDQKCEFIKKEKLREDWNTGFGDVVNNETLRKILKLEDTDILVGSVGEIGITGIHLDDDNINFLESIGLLEENALDSYEDEMREFSIKEVIEKRNITKLIHVTNKKNLDSILKYGLLSLLELEKEQIEYEFNDPLRLEFRRDSICLSVSDYNNFLFGSYQKRYPKNEYVVLEIDPSILLIEGIEKVFCDYNAASRFTKKSSTNMEIMFKNKIKRRAKIKTRLKKEKYEPTSYQSEILYCGRIDPKYIIKYYDLEKIKLH